MVGHQRRHAGRATGGMIVTCAVLVAGVSIRVCRTAMRGTVMHILHRHAVMVFVAGAECPGQRR